MYPRLFTYFFKWQYTTQHYRFQFENRVDFMDNTMIHNIINSDYNQSLKSLVLVNALMVPNDDAKLVIRLVAPSNPAKNICKDK